MRCTVYAALLGLSACHRADAHDADHAVNRDGNHSALAHAAPPQPSAADRAARAPTYVAPHVPLGLNLAGVNYFATALPFVDAMKMADPWQTTNAPAEGVPNVWDTELADKLPHAPDGYPLELPVTLPGGQFPQIARASVAAAEYGGRYTLLFDGTGELDFPASPVRVVARTPGRIDFDVDAAIDRTLFLSITRSSRADHVRNVRLLLPGFASSYAQQLFHPTFLARLSGASTLRFMDWGSTNNSPLEHWADRTTPQSPSQAGPRGVALEYMIALANRLDADAWFCVPHRADDAYVEAMAKLIASTLDEKHRAYIEYSNELWNGIFEQSRWAAERGCREGLQKLAPFAGSCDDDGVRYWAGVKWNARRSGQIFAIFDRAFAQQPQRLVRVLAGQAQNDHLNQVLLEAFENRAIQPARSHADVLAIAPYVGGSLASDLVEHGQQHSISVSALLDRLEALIDSDVRAWTEKSRKIAERHGLRLVAYEGGQHLVAYGEAAKDRAFVDKLIAANRDPRMRSIYARMLAAWYAASGNGLMLLFDFAEAPSEFGAWGLLESQEQNIAAAPKYQAYLDQLRRFDNKGQP